MPMVDGPLDFASSIYPVFIAHRETLDRVVLRRFCGTSFMLPGSVWLTAGHVVAADPARDELYVVVHRRYDGTDAGGRWSPVHAVARAVSGADLASGFVKIVGRHPLTLSRSLPVVGEAVFTWGFPLVPEPALRADDGQMIYDDFTPRLLRGYVTRCHRSVRPDGTRPSVIEVDMPAPPGVSGAPLIRAGTNEVLGVVTGETFTQQGVYGWTFAEAGWTEVLWGLEGEALGGKNLATRVVQAEREGWLAFDPSGRADVTGRG